MYAAVFPWKSGRRLGIQIPKENCSLKKVCLLLGGLFALLTLAGSVYVLRSGGQASPGYAAVPMVLALACLSVGRIEKKP